MKTLISCLLLFFTFFTVTLSYGSDIGNQIEAQVGAGFMFISSGNNLNPESSKKHIYNLDSAAQRESSFIPAILPEITWDVGEREGVKLFFDTEPPIDEVGSFILGFGGQLAVENIATFRITTFISPFEEVWKNPYITGKDRETSDSSKVGARFSANTLFNSQFDLHFTYANEDIEDDEIGSLIPDMARDGDIYSLGINYTIPLSDSFSLKPQFSLRKGEYDGESSSFSKAKMKMKATYRHGRYIFNPELHISYSEYDETDRIFNEERDNTSYGAVLVTTYLAPFGYQNLALTCIVGYSRGNSNINFYDTEAANMGFFLSYEF